MLGRRIRGSGSLTLPSSHASGLGRHRLHVCRSRHEKQDRVRLRHFDGFFIEYVFDTRRYFIPHPKYLSLLRSGPEIDCKIDRRRGEFRNVYPRRRFLQHSTGSVQDPLYGVPALLQVIEVADAYLEPDTPRSLRSPNQHGRRVDLAIRENGPLSVVCS